MRSLSGLSEHDREDLVSLLGDVIHAKNKGSPIEDAPEFKTSCVSELPLTIVRGCRTLVALDETGLVVGLGILDPGGNRQKLVDDLGVVMLRSAARRPSLRLLD